MRFVAEGVDCPDKLGEIYALRPRAWKDRTTGFPNIASWSDLFDAEALHWAIYDDDQPIAAARLTIHTDLSSAPNAEVFESVLPQGLAGPIGVLTRLVVDKRFAGRGLSTLLDRVRIDHATSAGCRWVIGSTFAGQKRIDQMRGYGFQVLGEAQPYASGPLKLVGIEGGGGERRLSFSPQRNRGPTSLALQINPASGELGSAYIRRAIRPAR